MSLLAAGACSMEPEFPQSGEVGYGCYTESGDKDFVVNFNGDIAIIDVGDGPHELRFVRSIWPPFKDRYEGAGYTLRLDPEAYLRAPDGTWRGPCV